MRAILIKKFGGPEELMIAEIPQPVSGPEQLLVRVKACALNRADLLQRRGKYPPPAGESDIPGMEISGEVAAVGANVSRFKLDDKVFGLVGSGAYAEYCLLDEEMAMRVPEHLDFFEAAAIPEAFMTAMEAVFTLGQLQAEETILIHAGASGVGSAAIQMARSIGARVIATTGSQDKYPDIIRFGADEIINYKKDNFATEVMKLTNDAGVNVIIDFVGADYMPRHLEILQTSGRLSLLGLMGGTTAEIDLRQIQRKRLQIMGLAMRSRPLSEKRAVTRAFAETWLPLFTKGSLYPVIDSVFFFTDAQQAHERMEKNLNIGKIILSFDPSSAR
jgi:tumor protein p53-inducible protein 3